jgi:hypothetical protein
MQVRGLGYGIPCVQHLLLYWLSSQAAWLETTLLTTRD